MKKGVIKINQYANKDNTVESYVCFRKFIDFLQEKVKTDKGVRAHFFQFVLDKIRAYPALVGGISITEAAEYDDILELVSSIVLPLIEDENEAMFALTSGLAPEAFYSTNAFHHLFQRRDDEQNGKEWIDKEASLKIHHQIQYQLILQKVYGYELPQKREMLHSFFNAATGLYQYYRLHIDTRFVEVKIKGSRDAITAHTINECLECNDTDNRLEKLISPDNYVAKGFSILSLTDITAQQAVEQLSKIITGFNKSSAPEDFIYVTRLLQTMAGSSDYRFGLMPFFTVNNRAALLYENFPYNLIVKASSDAGIPKPVFSRYMNHYLKDPQFIIYQSSNNKNTLPVPVQEALKAAGIHYYALAPVYFNDVLVGILETGAADTVAPLTELQYGKLRSAMPYISQLLKFLIDKFTISIDAIVRDKFTVIQPSVQWKFNEVAWHYFRSNNIEHKNNALENISFKNVYPLYGAVDIRNSTIERNKSLREDLQLQLELLMGLLNYLNENGVNETSSIADGCRQWLAKMTAFVSVEEELQLNEFLFLKVHPLLSSFNNLPETLSTKIDAYILAIDEKTGITSSKRRQLENSIRLINKSLGKYFDDFKDSLQDCYPCYFEKFRTDGIEYDIYIGQSIAPKILFSIKDAEKLKSWQVKSMAEIAKLTHSLLPQLEHPLETTQLIFVNPRTIDISFRNDERRFDVEGAYNIRYHIVKKRIDKVNIHNSVERLTQPGKIAIVYFNERDAEEYTGYIRQLQQQSILLNDLEYLELEELQGVSGLKALRVGVDL